MKTDTPIQKKKKNTSILQKLTICPHGELWVVELWTY